jgi:hypothetical protein
MTITPVAPVDREKLVPVSTSILIDFDGVPTLVDVSGTVVFDGSFQAGWTGSLLNKPGGGKRLVLDPPSDFALGALVNVLATENGTEVLGYIFECGTERVTTTDDASSPRVVETGVASAPTPTPLWHHTFDAGGSPQVDEQGNYDFEVLGSGAIFQQPGIIDEAIDLGGAAYLRAFSPDVPATAYHQELTVNNAGPLATGYQIKVTLDTATLIAAGKMHADSRVKFLDAGDNELDYWFEGPENSSASVYYVKVDLAAGLNTIRAEYSGAVSYAANEAAGDDVFELFDDFEDGSIDAGKWNVNGVGWGESGGNLTGGINNAGNFIESVQAFNSPVIVTTKSLETTAAVNGFTTIGFFNSSTDQLTILSHNGTSYYRTNGTWVNFAFNSLNAETIDEVTMTGTQGRVRRIKSGQTYDSGFISNTLNGENLFLGARGDLGSYGQTYVNSWRYVHVRQYNASVGAVIPGSETNFTLPVLVPPVPDPLKSQAFSVDGWFQVQGPGTERVLASCGRDAVSGWELRLTAGNLLQATVWGGGFSHSETSSSVFTVAGTWVHVGVAVDAAQEMLRLVVNGVQEAESGSWTGGFTVIDYVPDPDMELGRNPVTDSEYFPGRLDNWRYQEDVLHVVQFRGRHQQGVEPTRYPYAGYVRDPGSLHLRQTDPLTPEIKAVDGEIVDIGYDPNLDKLIVFFVNNGKVFVTAADPGDGPTTLTQPSALHTNVAMNQAGAGKTHSFTSADFPPLKFAAPLEPYKVQDVSSGRHGFVTGDPRTVTPVIISLDPAIIRLAKPTEQSGNRDAAGFIPLKFTKEAARRLPFVPLPEGDNIVDFQDPVATPGARYACLVVYRQGPGSTGLVTGPRGPGATRPFAADVHTAHGGSSGRLYTFTSADFPPLKLAIPLDTHKVGDASSGRSFSFTATGFPPIGVG